MLTRRWLCLMVAPLVLLAGCEMFTEPLGGLELRLTAGADTMVAGESIPVTIVVRNGGVFPLAFSGSSSCTIGVEVVHPDRTATGRPTACRSDLRTWTLGPGDSLVVERTWGASFTPPGTVWPIEYAGPPAPGTYRLRPFVDAVEDERAGPAVAVEVLPAARAGLVHSHPVLPLLDLVVGGRRAVADVAYGSPSGTGFVATGRQSVEIRRAGASTALASGEFDLDPGKRYVFAVRAGAAGPEPWLITDLDTVTSTSRTRLRLINLAMGAPVFAVRAVAPDGADPLQAMPPLSYGVAWPYVLSEPGWWRLAIVADGADTLAWWSLRLRGGQVRTLVLLDGREGGLFGLLLEP